MLNGVSLRSVHQFKYLGYLEIAEMEKERRALSVRKNTLIRKFTRRSQNTAVYSVLHFSVLVEFVGQID